MAILTLTSAGQAREQVVENLTRLLADTYALYLKTHGYHWNVTGPHFHPLHRMFEEQYTEMWQAVDVIAERIRALGAMAPHSHSALRASSSIAEDDEVPEAMDMVRRLAADHEKLLDTARAVLRESEAVADAATLDLATERIAAHEKTLWMLRATTV